MGQSRKKLYLAVLAVSGIGLVIDRFVLTESTTAPAVAAAQSGAPTRADSTVSATGAGESASIPEIPFPPGLKTTDELIPIPDLFAPPNVRMRGNSNSGRPYNGATGVDGRRPSERLNGAAFERSHTLEGVLVNQRLRMAVLEGRPVRIGDTVDGCVLKKIAGYRAEFECHDGPAVLKVRDIDTYRPG